jgi:CSLREA domain-containing protein
MTRASRLAAAVLLALVLATGAARAQATYTVTKAEDTDDGVCDADCSLREALAAANARFDADIIVFDPTLAGQTIPLTLGELFIRYDLHVNAGSLGVAVSGNDASRVFRIGIYDPMVDLIGLTITGGRTMYCGELCGSGGAGILIERGVVTIERCIVEGNYAEGVTWGHGGGIMVSQGTVALESSIVRGNTAEGWGGGIATWGVGAIRNSTISGNTAGEGGGLWARTDDVLVVENTTISENSSGGVLVAYNGGYGAVTLFNSTVTRNDSDGGSSALHADGNLGVRNSIVAGNTVNGDPNHGHADCAFGIHLLGHNVVGSVTGCSAGETDRTVAPADVFTLVLDSTLALNGGPTPTHALRDLADNPALDIGGDCGPTDQRGAPAPADGPDPDVVVACDAGAFELATGPVTVTAYGTTVLPPEGGTATVHITVTNLTAEPQAWDLWGTVAYTGSTTDSLAFGPEPVALGPGEAVTLDRSHTVAALAPPGYYRYATLVGTYPDDSLALSAFRFTKEEQPYPPLVSAVPDDPPVVIPPEGGAFDFVVTVRSQQTFGLRQWDVWGTITTPDGTVVEPTFGPDVVELGPGDAVARTQSQVIPGSGPAGSYVYRVYAGAYPEPDGEGASFGFEKLVDTASEPGAGGPTAFALHEVRPNPFASWATLAYDVPERTHVRLVVYDVLGREVAVLVDREREAGRHEAAFDGHELAPGTYFVRLEAGDTVRLRPVTRAGR